MPKKKSFFKETLIDEVEFKKIPFGFWNELKDLYRFYISDKDKKELAGKNVVWRVFIIHFRIFKAMLKRLTPLRRLITFVGFILVSFQFSIGKNVIVNSKGLGALFIIIVLLLELKDKLLAKDELQTGRKVQLELLPRIQPKLEGWDIWMSTLPANDVGGDLIDYQLFGDKLFLTLGDVSGKGLGAALYMARLQATLRAVNSNTQPLSDVVTRVNNIFYRDGVPGRFASLLALKLEKENSHVLLVNAGHLPPLVKGNHVVNELGKGGAALGLMENAVYTESTIQLNQGDVLVVFSDGITEAKNKEGMFYGDERLKTLLQSLPDLPAKESGYKVLNSVLQYSHDVVLHDDISLLVIKKY